MAPKETSLISLFSKRCDVVFGDLSPEHYPHVNVIRVDLMDMSSLDPFGVFYASHVMEHVPDDRQVFSNVYDRLAPGGEAWIMVPLHDAPTIDGTRNMTSKERERQFGQWDHVRQYGLDIVDRMQNAGFETSIIGIESFSSGDVARYGLSSNDKIFVGRRC
jgi:SAM-dependent methyltransferase